MSQTRTTEVISNDEIPLEALSNQVVSLNTDAAIPANFERVEVVDSVHDREENIIWPSGHKLWLTMASVFLGELMVGLDLTIVAVAIPSLTDQFHTVADIGWYTATYGLVASSLTFLMGKICTLYSIKKVYICSMIIFELGALLSTVAPTSFVFILGRAVSGIGKAGTFACANMCIVQSFPNPKRPLWMGLTNGVFTLAMVAAPLIGGALIDAWSWRLCFAINLPLGTIATAMVWYGFHTAIENPLIELPFREKLRRLDLWGTLVLVPAISCLLLALQWGGTKYGWDNAVILVLFAIATLLTATFFWIQHRQQDNAILPPRILRNRSILAGTWFSVCINGALATTEQYLSIYFQGVKGYPAVEAGFLGVPLIIGICIGALTSGAAISKVGYYAPFMFATTVLAPIGSGLLTTLEVHENNVKILACLGLLGFACGLGISIPVTAVQTILEPHEIAIGTAVVGFGGGMGSSIFTCVAATLFQNRLGAEIAQADPSVSVEWLRTVGLSQIRAALGHHKLSEVLWGYDHAVAQTMYLPLALAVLTLVGSLAMEWRSVKRKNE